MMVLDIQGSGYTYTLFDPEVASKEASSDGEYLFCTGNLHTIMLLLWFVMLNFIYYYFCLGINLG